jgi:uncharacterized repeat protein (TIGR03803 family)
LTLLTSSALAVASLPAVAQTYTVLHEFTGTPDGSLPNSGAITDAAGNIYTVADGGSANSGALFKIDPAGNISTLYSFACATGCGFFDNPLALAAGAGAGPGTLYGTTTGGGPTNAGTVFSIQSDGTGYTVLHVFDGKDGFFTGFGTLQFTKSGGLVGITAEGGNQYNPAHNLTGQGVLFSISRAGQFRKLHDFNPAGDGHIPSAVLIDAAQNVYGSTSGGGSYGKGTIYKLSLTTGVYSILYQFTGDEDGSGPVLGSIGPDGTLYGVTLTGKGRAFDGTLFSLSPSGAAYTLDTLAYSTEAVGAFFSGPTLAPSGKLLVYVGNSLFVYDKVARQLLQQFETAATGEDPTGQLALAPDGSIVGTTSNGGLDCPESEEYGCGVVFRYTPQ